jgi:hypothetical protein
LRDLLRILVVIPLGFVASCIAAAGALMIAAAPRPEGGQLMFEFVAVHAFAALIFAFFVGFFALVPAVVAIVLSEIFRWRSPLPFLGIGALIGFGLYVSGLSGEEFPEHASVFGAAGAVGGAAYWLVAGRNAGFEKARPKPMPDERTGGSPPA